MHDRKVACRLEPRFLRRHRIRKQRRNPRIARADSRRRMQDDDRVELPRQQPLFQAPVRRQDVDPHAFGRMSEREVERLGALPLADLPGNVPWIDAMLVAEEAAHDHRGGHVVFLQPDRLAPEILRTGDAAIRPHEYRRMPEGTRQERRDQRIGKVALRDGRDGVAERNLADIERSLRERPRERDLGPQDLDRQRMAFHRDPAVDQREGAVVVPESGVQRHALPRSPSVGCRSAAALRHVPRHREPLGEVHEVEQDRAQHAKQHDRGEHPCGLEHALGGEDGVAQPHLRGHELAGDGADERERDRDLHAREHGGQRGRKADLPQHLERRGAHRLGEIEDVRVDRAQPEHGIDDDREQRDQHGDRHLGARARPHPDDEKRGQGDLRNGVERDQERVQRVLEHARIDDPDRRQDPDHQREEKSHQAGPDGVGGMPRIPHRIGRELDRDLRRRRQDVVGHAEQAHAELPEREEADHDERDGQCPVHGLLMAWL